MFNFIIIIAVAMISLHVASYGLYALREEQNHRGAVGAFITAGVTFLAPVLLMWIYAYFNY
ncbi:hypothetical protein IT084_12275 [Desulfallas sp. Bu1-1]|jgi:hypothetical protein|uniref:hypothetical protein n=1 Tax=Desulfallas sp. Bu1-1 TaxID=2787620 RepID=UPI00189F9087|nr:hypothetical protein [Desulfallas sp. Bu1-1]MBF7083749.1 hypothetical protein [Desulfallas sp. Bu1-1]